MFLGILHYSLCIMRKSLQILSPSYWYKQRVYLFNNSFYDINVTSKNKKKTIKFNKNQTTHLRTKY